MSLHNHTRWSDGSSSVEEMVDAAAQAGLEEVGISDHYVLTPDNLTVDWSMPLDALPQYVAEVRRAAGRGDVQVLLGVEADYFPETVDQLHELALTRHPFDYVIGSVHFLDGFPVDSYAAVWKALSEDERNDKWRLYWKRVGQMAESGRFDFVGHLDLPKKFGYLPTVDLTAESSRALDAIAAAGMALEINTAGWEKPIGEAYPAFNLLREARNRQIPILITADAHRPRDLTKHFERARDLARQARYAETVTYAMRKRALRPMLR